jgi:hypothetical protein
METKITREVGETFFVLLDRRRPTPLLHWSFAIIIHGETSGINQAIRLPQTISANWAKKKKNTSPLLMSCHLHLFRKQATLTYIFVSLLQQLQKISSVAVACLLQQPSPVASFVPVFFFFFFFCLKSDPEVSWSQGSQSS